MPNSNHHVRERQRLDFAKIQGSIQIPNLIEVQMKSYQRFLQMDLLPSERDDGGLQSVFTSVFPIRDFREMSQLEFVDYSIGNWECKCGNLKGLHHLRATCRNCGASVVTNPYQTGDVICHKCGTCNKCGDPVAMQLKYDVNECQERGMTYSAPLKVTIRLTIYDKDPDSGAKTIRDIKEQEVFYGDIPLMTENGTFIINGTERVIVSQLHRSPGVFFESANNRSYFLGKIIPYRGSWVEFEYDTKNILYVRIDRKRKFLGSIFLRALGMKSNEDILRTFYQVERISLRDKDLYWNVSPGIVDRKLTHEIKNPRSEDVIVGAHKRITENLFKELIKAKVSQVRAALADLEGAYSVADVVNRQTGEVLLEANKPLTADVWQAFAEAGITEVDVFFPERDDIGLVLSRTLDKDSIRSSKEALIEIYRKLRPGDPPTLETATNLFRGMFFDPRKYDFSRVGRLKFNIKMGLDTPLDNRTLDTTDFVSAIKYLFKLRKNIGVVDDIDHLGNRRVRAVGELLENQFRIGSIETPEGPNIGLISSLSCFARINDYGFIESPYRRVKGGRIIDYVHIVNAGDSEFKAGDIVERDRVEELNDELKRRKVVYEPYCFYLSAWEEDKYVVAQANVSLDDRLKITTELVNCRQAGNFVLKHRDEVDYVDVSPKQLVSVAASLIPFLENDDANRALMGSNMQRQAVPLIKTEAPLVGTGLERTVGRDSGVTVIARRDGVVESIDAERVVVRAERQSRDPRDAGVDIYNLIKYQRSNQNTCINQRPVVVKGERVTAGDVLADGPSTEMGELALGRNVLVAFMPWGGYNFEDSILISERVVKEDLFTSVHIEEFECIARDTKLGPEEITRDIPNVGEEALKDLDTSGIIRIGAEVKPGDILVGKITPKGETQLSPEEKLLRAIFGEKAGEVRDTSLRVPPGVEGVVVNARVFARRGVARDDRSQEIQNLEGERLKQDEGEEIRIIRQEALRKLKRALAGKKLAARVMSDDRRVLFQKGDGISAEDLDELAPPLWGQLRLENEAAQNEIAQALAAMSTNVETVQKHYEDKVARLKAGDELAPGVIKMIKVFVAIKRRLQVGDKMAGRHGNKGVLSRILPVEDMPRMADGTAVDIVLNPLGVPSRMNVGQILETHLGWAALELGRKLYEEAHDGVTPAQMRRRLRELYPDKEYQEFIEELTDAEVVKLADKARNGIHSASPVFDGAREDEIFNLLKRAGLPETGQCTLYDGRTGAPFEQPVTVGVMYIMKLHHLVEDKIHARSTGPYSLVTQQPLGGKAQFGGQRLGEMEVWALEAYGAAYSLQEMLTVKSDDVAGRTRMYEAIVKGENVLEPGLPESFNVMVKELQSLALDVELLEDKKPVAPTTGGN